jgi:predicted metal-dependent peptidase
MIRVINPSDDEALEWVQAARSVMVKPENLPYLRVPVMRLRLVEETSGKLPTAAVDSSWRMYYNPEFMVQGDIETTAAIVEHEIWHLLRRHPERAKARFVNQRTARLWNFAADAEIHNDPALLARIKKTGIDPVTAASLGEKFGGEWIDKFVPGLLAEEYYNMILEAIEEYEEEEEEEEGEGPGGYPGGEEEGEDGEGGGGGWGAEPGGGNCGSSATGVPTDWELPPDDEVSNISKELIRKRVAEEIVRSAALGRGVEKGSMAYEWAQEELAPPKVNWQRQLQSAVKNAIAFVSGATEYTRRKLSRRQVHHPGILLPGLQKPVAEVAIVVDASGSMFAQFESGNEEAEEKYNLLQQALSETQSIIKKHGMGVGINVYATDTTAYFAGRIFSPSQMSELQGGGGTDIGVGIKAAYHGRPKPQIIIVLTDGATPWPDTAPPRTKVIVGLIGSTAEDIKRHGWPLPDWAKVVEIVD